MARPYGELDLPVKVTWGREDTWIPVDRGAALADTVTGAELDVIDDAGHLIQSDAPVRLATSLYRWLTANARARGASPNARRWQHVTTGAAAGVRPVLARLRRQPRDSFIGLSLHDAARPREESWHRVRYGSVWW